MKGILLAGGSGSRLHPLTASLGKQLLPIYDKPMIHYPLGTLMLAGIRNILVISSPRDLGAIKELLGDGGPLGIKLSYASQEKPEGIAQALLIGEDFIDGDSVCLILGDNIFYGESLRGLLQEAAKLKSGAKILACRVQDPERYGVVHFDRQLKANRLEEKPRRSTSPWAVTGLYFYDSAAVGYAKLLQPSKRGELEITDLNQKYLEDEKLKVEVLRRGVAWLDAGTPDSLLAASLFVQTLEKRQGLKIGCIEEIALRMGFIDESQFESLVEKTPVSSYRDYLKKALDDHREYS